MKNLRIKYENLNKVLKDKNKVWQYGKSIISSFLAPVYPLLTIPTRNAPYKAR